MLFNSVEFLLLFLPCTLLAWACARRYGTTAALVVLLVASLLFYSAWDWRHTPLIVASAAVNYLIGAQLASRRSRRLLWAGIALNLLPLAWFKYASWVGGLLGLSVPAQPIPLGISFVTFLQIAFLVEAYAQRLPPIRPLDYAVFVAWFPHLISGPILRFAEIQPQLQRICRPRPNADEQAMRATLLILAGLFSKVVIADTMGRLVDPLYERAPQLGLWEAWAAAIGYSVQLLADFSGFCTVALGVSLLFGIRLPLNFWSPYQATSISDFWRRWHMTLGQWFRDYVYLPLGGNRRGRRREIVALLVTFVLCGLWHGAAATFLLWGLLHGAMVVIHRLWRSAGLTMPDRLGQLLTLICVVAAWVPFRATSIGDAVAIWKAMVGVGEGGQWPPSQEVALLLPVACALLGAMATVPNVNEWKLTPRPAWGAALAVLALTVSFSLGQPSPYLYWQW